jgi:hypothetical protein
LYGEGWRILAPIVKIKDEDAIDTRRHQKVFFIVELSVINKPEMRHIKMRLDHYVEIVHEYEFKFRRHYQVKLQKKSHTEMRKFSERLLYTYSSR